MRSLNCGKVSAGVIPAKLAQMTLKGPAHETPHACPRRRGSTQKLSIYWGRRVWRAGPQLLPGHPQVMM